MKSGHAMFVVLAMLVAFPAWSQPESAASANTKLLGEIKSDKKLLIANNMQLTDAESTKFWPVYDAFQKDLLPIEERFFSGIVEYADAYKARTLSDSQARQLAEKSMAIDGAELGLQRTYFRKLLAILPARKAVRYLQLERKIRIAVQYEAMANIPLVY